MRKAAPGERRLRPTRPTSPTPIEGPEGRADTVDVIGNVPYSRPVFQLTRHKIANPATLIEAGRALCYEAARRYAAGLDCVKEVSMCKAFCADVANRVATECLQMHGGYGYMKEFYIERFFRDARLYPIGGGSTETMKEIIAKRMGLYAPEWVATATHRDRDTVS